MIYILESVTFLIKTINFSNLACQVFTLLNLVKNRKKGEVFFNGLLRSDREICAGNDHLQAFLLFSLLPLMMPKVHTGSLNIESREKKMIGSRLFPAFSNLPFLSSIEKVFLMSQWKSKM